MPEGLNRMHVLGLPRRRRLLEKEAVEHYAERYGEDDDKEA